MKLITYLEQIKEQKINTVDIANGLYNINIEYYDHDLKRKKKITFQIETDKGVQDLSKEIFTASKRKLSIPATDPSYESNKKLYEIFLADDPEFNVIYDPKNNYTQYEVRIINNKSNNKSNNILRNIRRFFTKQ
jgi:hypothetical protein